MLITSVSNGNALRLNCILNCLVFLVNHTSYLKFAFRHIDQAFCNLYSIPRVLGNRYELMVVFLQISEKSLDNFPMRFGEKFSIQGSKAQPAQIKQTNRRYIKATGYLCGDGYCDVREKIGKLLFEIIINALKCEKVDNNR